MVERLSEWIAYGARRLRSAGIESPERDARLLVAFATGGNALDLIANPERPVDALGAGRIRLALDRRAAGEPVSRIMGAREFYGRSFKVAPATLDPRPDSETLIDAALEIADEEGWRERPIRILDIGTGTGCLLLTVLAELDCATGLGTDIDPAALEVAAENARRLGLASRVQFACGRSLSGIDETFDLLISNPPYIPSADIPGLAPEVRDHDPLTALDGGPDGCTVYREIAARCGVVVPRGWVVLEIGAGHSGLVSAVFASYRRKRFRQDLGGHTRCMAVQIQS